LPSCREYITGFRKRKQARRKDALSNLEKKQRQQRIEERAEVRGNASSPFNFPPKKILIFKFLILKSLSFSNVLYRDG
jgi:hypothetical protein